MLISVNKKDKDEVIEVGKIFEECGFRILATDGTNKVLNEAGIKSERVNKIYEGQPNINDMIINGEIQIVINSPVGKASAYDDSYLRKAAIKAKVPYVTTVAAAKASAEGIRYVKKNASADVQSLQAYHSQIK